MSCGAPGMCGHRRDCADKHCPGRHMEPPDMMRDGPLLAGLGVSKKQPEGLHVTSCAVWLGLRGEW